MEKILTTLIILFMVIVGCGMLYGRTVQNSRLPNYVLVQPDNQELLEAPLAQPQAGITQPITQPVTVNVTLVPVDDDREARAQVIWRFTLAVALGLAVCFLIAATGISLSIK